MCPFYRILQQEFFSPFGFAYKTCMKSYAVAETNLLLQLIKLHSRQSKEQNITTFLHKIKKNLIQLLFSCAHRNCTDSFCSFEWEIFTTRFAQFRDNFINISDSNCIFSQNTICALSLRNRILHIQKEKLNGSPQNQLWHC